MAFDTLLDSVLQAIATQASVSGGPSTTDTNYNAFLANALAPQIPGNETVTDESMVGDGSSRTLRNVYNYYWTERGIPISGELNDHIAAILMRGFLGGANTVTTISTALKDNSIVQKVSNNTPMFYSMYRHMGGEQFIHADLFPNSFRIAQEGEARPTFNFDMMGTGKFVDDVAIATASFSDANVIAAPSYNYFHGAATVFTATDGVTTYDFTNQGVLQSLSIEGSNGGRTARRPGDLFQAPADRNSGAFARAIAWGKASALVRVKIDLGSSLASFKAMLARKTLTSGSIKFISFDKFTGGAFDYEYQINFPKSRFRVVAGDTDQDFGALSLEIQPERDSVTKGYFTARIRTDKTALMP